jgi:hypothetical protein
MALPVSSVSEVCVHIRDFLKTQMAAASIKIGIPADAANSERNTINLFFYRFDTSGFEAALRPDEIWRIRMYCLITPFGKDEESVSAGENDLRLLGGVMKVFHEQRLHQIKVDGATAHLQVIFLSLSDEQLNQVWSTQGEATYRPSVVYEMSLTPIVPSTVRGSSSRVGALGTQLHADMGARYAQFPEAVAVAPPVVKSTVNLTDPAWIPRICFIYQGQCVQSLSFDIEGPNFSRFTPQVWVAGDNSESVSLVWEVWENVKGWTKVKATVTVTPFNSEIDPDNIPSSVPSVFPFNLSLPSTLTKLAPNEFSRQALLYATRRYTPIAGPAAMEMKSNPLLVSIYRNRP